MTPQPSEQPDCGHPVISRFWTANDEVRLWACADCQRRFYPACPVCVVVGHRNEVHEAAVPDPVASPRWEEWARRLAPLVHDGLIDTPNERQIIDKAFALARLLDEHLPDPVASPAPLDVERLARAMASDQEMFRLLWPDENGLDLAAERIAAEYARLEGQPVAESPDAD